MSKKGPQTPAKPDTGTGTGGGGAPRIDIGDLTEAVTQSVTRALNIQDINRTKLPIRIIVGIVMEPPERL